VQESKPCRICGVVKPLSEFPRNRTRADGHDGRCKECIREETSSRAGIVSSKLCECGCGEFVLLASITNRRNGWVVGQPLRFVHGHQVRMRWREPRPVARCSIEGCEDDSYRRGWCVKHWARWLKHGSPHWEPPVYPATCSVKGCGGSVKGSGKGLCGAHRRRLRVFGGLLADIPIGSIIGPATTSRRRSVRLYSSAQKRSKWSYWGGRCWMCGNEAVEWDHVKPLAKGGPDCLANLRPACMKCNRSKSSRWPLPSRLASRLSWHPSRESEGGAIAA
jgi:5-methylcytosine-specific restriction endonuclease McrA